MDVALLYPQIYDMARFGTTRKEFPPLGILNLAAAIEHAGHRVRVLPVSPGHESLDLRGYPVVGFSLSSSATVTTMTTARTSSLIDPGTLVMIGGLHATLYPEQTLRDLHAHVACLGQSEDTIAAVLDAAPARDFTGIPGVLWHDHTGTLRRQAPPRLPRSLDGVPLPARHLLPANDLVVTDRLAGTNLTMTHVAFSRGCAFTCAFCSAGRTPVRYRSGADAHRELASLIDTYGIDGFAVVEDNFTVSRRNVLDIAEAIADLHLAWSAPSRVDTVDPPLLRALARSGCIELKYGMESGSPRILAAMGKRTDPDRIRQAITWTTDAGIGAKVFILHGFPGENTESTHETIRMLTTLGSAISRVSLFRFVPLPGSPVYEHAEHYGIHGTHHQPDWDGDWSKFHIHHNTRHWWGDHTQWRQVKDSAASNGPVHTR
ncbi:MAG: Radical superfamily enzyme YgiQ family [Actinomycetota bacterium]|nr:Radical superfamily enzyme YgiQ family [Actinomycetota bacterium]